jgi:hypothetical protein
MAANDAARRREEEKTMARQQDLTLNEVLADPMILAVALADGWSKTAFRDEMMAASRELRSSVRPPMPQGGRFIRAQAAECGCCA